MNNAAPSFFHMIQEELWESRLLHIARITNASATGGKTNLTIRNLPDLVPDAAAKAKVSALADVAIKTMEFCQVWRNRRIGHKDLKLAIGEPAKPLADASRKRVKDALKAIADVMDAVEGQYFDSQTGYDLATRYNGAVALLYVLNDGVKTRCYERHNMLPKEKSEAELFAKLKDGLALAKNVIDHVKALGERNPNGEFQIDASHQRLLSQLDLINLHNGQIDAKPGAPPFARVNALMELTTIS
ncbi:hypothetical protein [Bradyrhizobium sp. I1.14.4]|uniref:AbiU2 domain-containing protein n=1 Tax=unclassified Bradyrhizobium TaxID=2631580 RepID=UPI003D24D8F4